MTLALHNVAQIEAQLKLTDLKLGNEGVLILF